MADLVDEGVQLNPGIGGLTIGVEAVPNQVAATTIAVGSNGASLPQTVIFAAATTGFPSSGTLLVTTAGGTFAVQYTSITGGGAPSFNGCSGGSGAMATGGAITSGALVEIVKVMLGADGVNGGFIASGNPLPVSAAALPLPAGAATAANQATEIVGIASILARQADGTQETQIVGAVPLPTGAATEVTLAAIKAKTDNLDVALSTRAVTGLTDAQLRASAVPVTTTQLPAALVGGRLDENIGAWLGSTAPTVGQKAAAASLPVVLQNDLVNAGGVKITDGVNTLPTADVAARKLFAAVTDGVNTQAVKAAGTAALVADPSAVVAFSPNSPLPAGANSIGAVTQGAGVNNAASVPWGTAITSPNGPVSPAGANFALLNPYGSLRVSPESSNTFNDNFDGAVLDTTDRWTVTQTSGLPFVQGGGQLTITGTVAANYFALLQSKPTFQSAGSTFELWAGVIKLDATANIYRFWGVATTPGVPTAAAPITDGIGFEVTVSGALQPVVYQAGLRAAVGAPLVAPGVTNNRYAIFIRADIIYWFYQGVENPVAVAQYQFTNTQALPYTVLQVNNAVGPAGNPVMNLAVAAIQDTGRNAAGISDGALPFRKMTVKAASTAAIATDLPAVVALHPTSPLPTGANTVGNVKVTDGANFQPTADIAARKLFTAITDGANTATVKAASTAAVAADTALVVALSPNNPPAALAVATAGATALGALNAAVTIATLGQATVSFLLAAGTLIGTLTAEWSPDNATWSATSFISPTTLSAAQTIVFGSANTVQTRSVFAPPGCQNIRIRVSAYTSGTANGSLRGTQTVPAFMGVYGVGTIGATAAGAPLLLGGMDPSGFLQTVNLTGAAPLAGLNALVTTPGKLATYRAVITNLAIAAAATDVFTITGSGPARIRVKHIAVSGTQTTAGSVNIQLIKRSVADTLGTSTAPTKVSLFTGNPAATAAVAAYTANPTLGAAVGLIGSKELFLPAAASVAESKPVEWAFADFETQMDLTTAAEQICINLNGQTILGGSLNIEIEFTEN